MIILLSDGEHMQSKDGKDAEHKPRAAAQLAANLKYAIYTIDAGGDLPPTADPDALAEREAGRQTLRDVAEMTGCEVVRGQRRSGTAGCVPGDRGTRACAD